MDTLAQIQARQAQRRQDLERALPAIVEQLKELGALQVILFGSLARGHVTRWSDLDLIAIMPPSRSSREWQQEIYTRVERHIASDILAYTEEDLATTLPVSRFLRHALQEGKVIYEKRTP